MNPVNTLEVNSKKIVRVLLVEDDAELAGQILDQFQYLDWPDSLHWEVETEFSRAMEKVEATKFDLLILDVRDGKNRTDHGVNIFKQVKSHVFVPIIFHTAYPEMVKKYADEYGPLIRVVAKGGPTSNQKSLVDVVEEVLKEKLPQMKRAVREHVDGVLRDYMWQMVKSEQQRVELIKHPPLLVHVLARQIVHSLDAAMLPKLFASMKLDETVAEGKIHPVQMYIYPPRLSVVRGTGDVVNISIAGSDVAGMSLQGLWMVISNRCDLVSETDPETGKTRKPKIQNVVMAKIRDIREHPKVILAHSEEETPEKTQARKEVRKAAQKDSKNVIQNSDRYFYLPKLLGLIPDSFVDFNFLVSVPLEGLSGATVVATLDDPYIADMLMRYQRFYGRFGTADVDQARLRTLILDRKST